MTAKETSIEHKKRMGAQRAMLEAAHHSLRMAGIAVECSGKDSFKNFDRELSAVRKALVEAESFVREYRKLDKP